MERTNFRYMVRDDIQDDLDFASVDVSFISLTKILLPARRLLKPAGQMVCLIKPQFEAGREKVGKKGVVREPAVHREVIEKIVDFASFTGFFVKGLTFSPVRGPEGNIEYLIWIEKNPVENERVEPLSEADALRLFSDLEKEEGGLSHTQEWQDRIAAIVEQAHAQVE